MIEELYQHFGKQADAKQAAAKEFLKPQKQQESVYKQEVRELRISPATADSLVQAYVQAKKINDLGRIEAIEGNLTEQYRFFPDDNSREKALSSLHPGLKDYTPQFSRVENYGVIYRFFIRRLQDNLLYNERNIDGVRDEKGVIDVNKLQIKVDQAAEAVKFIKDEKQGLGLNALVMNKIVDIFNQPDSVKKWQPFINSLSNEAQAILFHESIISDSNDFKKTPPKTSEALQEWVKATHWVNSEEKVDLVREARAFRNIDTLNYWKPAIEHICQELLAIQKSEGREGIKKGESKKLFEEIEGFILRNIDRNSPPFLTPEDVIKKWEGLFKR